MFFCWFQDAANYTDYKTYGIKLQQILHVCLFYACAGSICQTQKKDGMELRTLTFCGSCIH